MQLIVELDAQTAAQWAQFAGARTLSVPQVAAIVFNFVRLGTDGTLELPAMPVGAPSGTGPAWTRKRLAQTGPSGQVQVQMAPGPDGVDRYGHNGLSDPSVPLSPAGRELALRRARWFPPEVGDRVFVHHYEPFVQEAVRRETYKVAEADDGMVALERLDEEAIDPAGADGDAPETEEEAAASESFADQVAGPGEVLLPLWKTVGPHAVIIVRDGVVVHHGPRDRAAETSALAEQLGLPEDAFLPANCRLDHE